MSIFRSHSAHPASDAEAQLPLLVEVDDDVPLYTHQPIRDSTTTTPISASTPFTPPPDYDLPHSRPPHRTRRGPPMPIPLLDVDPPTYDPPSPTISPAGTAPTPALTPLRRFALIIRFALELVLIMFAVLAALAFGILLAWGALECAGALLLAVLPGLAQLWATWWTQPSARSVSQGVRVALATLLFPALGAFVIAFVLSAALALAGAIKFAFIGAPHIVRTRWYQMKAGE